MSVTTRRLATAVGGVLLAVVGYVAANSALPNHLPQGILLKGAVLGGLQALVAMGLVLLYRSSRIINFAQAAIGTVAASVAIVLRAGWGVPYALAVPAGLASAVALGWAIDQTVARRFAQAPRLVFTVATIGLQQLLAAANLELPRQFHHLSSTTTFTTPFSFHFHLYPLVFTGDSLVALAVVPVALVLLFWFFQRTDTGVAIRAAADSFERALLLGIPVRNLSMVTWMVAAGLSGVGAILSAPITGQNIGQLVGPSVLLIPLAAAVLARMESLPMTVVWSIVLVEVQEAVAWNFGKAPYTDVAAFVLVLVGLLLQRHREMRVEGTELGGFTAFREVAPIPLALAQLREVKAAKLVGAAVVLAVAAVVPLQLSAPELPYFVQFVVYGVLCVSLVVLTGWAGQISLGQFAFAGVGAAVTGALMVHLHVDLLLCMAASALAGAAVACVIGVPALRIPGLYLAVTTMAFADAMATYFLSPTYFPWLDPTSVNLPVLFKRFDLSSPYTLYEFSLLVLVGCMLMARNLRRTRTGRVVVAVRENGRGASAYGISPLAAKLTAFAFSGAVAGVGGALYVLFSRGIDPAGFTPDLSFTVFIAAVIGGLGSLTGAVVGAGYVAAAIRLPDVWGLFAMGTGLMILLMVFPEGLGGLVFKARDALLLALARRKGIEDLAAASEQVRERQRPQVGQLSRAEAKRAMAVIGSGGVNAAAHTAALRLGALEDLEVRGRSGGFEGAAPDAGPPAGRPSLVAVRDVDAAYGPAQVLFDVSFGVAQGEVVALLGTNGAGKSTTLRTVAGLLEPVEGRVRFVGEDITEWTPAERVKAGLVTVLGGRGIFPSLSVAENLRMGAWTARRYHRDPAFVAAATERVLEIFPRLRERMHQRAGLLSGGEQQMLALAQALLCKPKLLLIDELSLGLAPSVVGDLLEVVRALAQSGVTVVVVEQSVNVATAISTRAVFIERGRIRFSGPTPDLSQQPKLLRSVFLHAANRAKRRRGAGEPAPAGATGPEPLLDGGVPASRGGDDAIRLGDRSAMAGNGAGRPAAPSATPGTDGHGATVAAGTVPTATVVPAPAGVAFDPMSLSQPTPAFAVVGASKAYGGVAALTDVNLHVMPGEILGIIGSNGAGKTTLFDVCSGFARPDTGRIVLFGEDITNLTPAQRAARGIGRVFQDARLFPSMTVSEVLTTALEQHVPVRDPVAGALSLAAVAESEAAIAVRVEELIVEFGLERFRDRFVSELSTGTRRVLELACAVAHQPRVLLLDEPSAGIAQRESEALGELLLGLREQTGAAFVVIEHDVPLVSSVADRLACMHVGEVIAEGDTASVLNDPAVVAAYLGADEVALHRTHGPAPVGVARGGAR